MSDSISLFCEKVISPIEEKRNEMRDNYYSKNIFKRFNRSIYKEFMDKYDDLLMDKYEKLDKMIQEEVEFQKKLKY